MPSDSQPGPATERYESSRTEPRADRAPMALVAPDAAAASQEIENYLRKRLKALCAVVMPVVSIVILVLAPAAVRTGYWQFVVICAVGWSIGMAATALVWSRRRLALHTLRAVELAILISGVALLVWFILDRNVRLRDAAIMATLGKEPFLLDMVPAAGPADQVQRWNIVLGEGFMDFFGSFYSLFWSVIIFGYALFIPNSLRRCLAIVGSFVILALLMDCVIAWNDAAVRGDMLMALLWNNGAWLCLAGGLAVFGSYRLESLRREAAQARRLGQYQLKQRLGAGGMGEVYLAEHVLLRRPCAIKLIRPERAGDPKNLVRFQREVQATATLTNWHTVEIFDYGVSTDGAFYYVMEYLPGLNLDQLVMQHGPLPPERAVHLLRQVGAALREAHGIGLIHRDIKPSNIIACRRGGRDDVAKLLDFGLVRAQSSAHDWEKLTNESDIAGTPSYMSPEQASGQDALDARTDIYSLGAVAYFLLAGRPPFTGKNAVQVLAAHLHEPPAPLTTLRADMPPDLEAVVLRCLAKEPHRRFAAVDDLLAALAACRCADAWTDARAASWWQALQ